MTEKFGAEIQLRSFLEENLKPEEVIRRFQRLASNRDILQGKGYTCDYELNFDEDSTIARYIFYLGSSQANSRKIFEDVTQLD